MANNEKAVDQARISDCKYCHAKLVWLVSKRTGGKYPVNYHGVTDSMGYAMVETNDFHECPRRPKK
jgi:hypothetical protein